MLSIICRLPVVFALFASACLSAPPATVGDGGPPELDGAPPSYDASPVDAEPLQPFGCTMATELDLTFDSNADINGWDPSQFNGCSHAVDNSSLKFTKSGAGRCNVTGDLNLDLRNSTLTAEIDPLGEASLAFSLLLRTATLPGQRVWLFFETDGVTLWRGTCEATNCLKTGLGEPIPFDTAFRFWRFSVSQQSVTLEHSKNGTEFFELATPYPIDDGEAIACTGVDLGSYDNGETAGTSGFTRLYTGP